MGNIIACVDSSAHADLVCEIGAWAAQRLAAPVTLLHVLTPHTDHAAQGDLSGAIGFGANSQLLEQLTALDEARGKLDQQQGKLILDHAAAQLRGMGVSQVEMLHRRGSLVETVTALEAQAELIVIGKRGEHGDAAPGHLGANLERVARAVHKPLLVSSRDALPIRHFLLAYDGGASTEKAVEYAATSPLLQGLECHLLMVGERNSASEALLQRATDRLTAAGFTVQADIVQGRSVEDAITAYATKHLINLLVIGAYGHAKLRSLILGSTTTALIRASTIPLLLFR